MVYYAMKYGGNMKIGVMTDVNAGLDYVGYDTKIPCLRSSVNFKDKSYVDGIDIRADEFYRRLLEVKVPKISLLLVHQVLRIYIKL